MHNHRAFANQEREFQVQRLRKVSRALLLTLATVLTFATVGLLAADQLYRPDTFVIQQLKIKGKFRHLQPQSIHATLAKAELGNFFSVDLSAIKARVEELPWVQRADVRREWPNSLELFVVEHRPIMRWGKDRWVSSFGDVISLPDSIKLTDAITLYGNEADAQRMLQAAFSWKQTLEASDLVLRSVRLSKSQAWTLGLFYPPNASNFELQLGHDDIEHRLARFEYLFDQQFRHADQALVRVDARYPNGLAVLAKQLETKHAAGADAVAANH